MDQICNNFQILNNKYKTHYALNLSGTSAEPYFMLARIIQIGNNCLVFDLRRKNKGNLSKKGVTILPPEMEWFRKSLFTNDNKIYTLEYNSRKLIIDKSIGDYVITMIKSDSTKKQILMEKKDLDALGPHIGEIYDRFYVLANECEIPTMYDETSYFRETVN